MAEPLLSLQGVHAGYGAARVLHGLDLTVARRETLVVIGRNGVGKTTLLETLIGLTTHHEGAIHFNGQRIETLPAHRRNRLGIAWVPQAREVFTSLSVEENLRVVARGKGPWDLDAVYGLFPRLRERRRNQGHELSGGEQQMLSMARALMTNPTLLLLDEPVEGLAPLVVEEMLRAIDRMRRDGDMTIVMVEQKWDVALRHADRCVVIDHGEVVHAASADAMLADTQAVERWLGVAA